MRKEDLHEYSYILSALNTTLCAPTGLHEYGEYPRRRSRYRLDNRCSRNIAIQSGDRDRRRSYTLLLRLLLRPRSKCSFIKNNEGRLPTKERAQ